MVLKRIPVADIATLGISILAGDIRALMDRFKAYRK